MNSEAVLGLAGFQITSIEHSGRAIRIQARYKGAIACPGCSAVSICGARAGIFAGYGMRAGECELFPDPGSKDVAWPGLRAGTAVGSARRTGQRYDMTSDIRCYLRIGSRGTRAGGFQ